MNQAALLPYFVEFLNRSILQLGSTYRVEIAYDVT